MTTTRTNGQAAGDVIACATARMARTRRQVATAAGVALRWIGAGLAVALLAAASHTDGPDDLRMDPMTAFDAKAACTAALAERCVARGRH